MKDLSLGLCSVLACLLSVPALAGREIFPVTNATYRAECGSCHVAYPPALLNAQAWQGIMARLDQHFDTDASLDAKAADEIRAYLSANAGRRATAPASKGLARITEARWFTGEHDEVPPAMWKSEAVKSPANCGACHTRAEQGDFSERALRLPK